MQISRKLGNLVESLLSQLEQVVSIQHARQFAS